MKRTKKLISIIAVLSLCLSAAFCGGIIKILADDAGTDLQIRPLITFEEGTATLTDYNMLKDDGKFDALQSSNNTVLSKDNVNGSDTSVKVTYGESGEQYAEIQTDHLQDTNKPMTDWNGVEFLQFWTKNLSSSAIRLDTTKIKQNGFNYAYKVNSTYHLLAKDSTTWTDELSIPEKDNANLGTIVIPANFEGFIRLSVTDVIDIERETTYNNSVAMTGFSFWFDQNPGDSAVFYIDDISVVGQTLASDTESAAKTVLESVYFPAFYTGTEPNPDPDPDPDPDPATSSVRPLLTFEEDTATLTALKVLTGDGAYNGLHKADTIALSGSSKYSGEKSVKIRLTSGEAYSEVKVDGLPTANKPQTDWSGAEYFQFWIRNTTTAPIILDTLSFRQLINSKEVTSRLLLGSKFLMLAKGTTEWTEGNTIPEKDNGKGWNEFNYGAIPVPAGFTGFIRVKLADFYNSAGAVNSFDKSVPVSGYGLWFYTADANNETFYLDDLALVGETLATDAASQALTVAETDYLEPFYADDPTDGVAKVKTLTSFETNETDLMPTFGLNWVPYSFGTSTKFKFSGEQSYRARVSNDPAGMEPYSKLQIFFPQNSPLANWEGAMFMMLWVKNNSLSSLKIGGFTISNVNGNELSISAGSDNVFLMSNGKTVPATVTTDSETSLDAFELPACFEGFILVNLAQLNVNLGDISDIKFFLINKDPKSEVYFDDLSIVGTDLTEEGSTPKPANEYLGSYKGGIVNDYNLSDFSDIVKTSTTPETKTETKTDTKPVDTKDAILITFILLLGSVLFSAVFLIRKIYRNKKTV